MATMTFLATFDGTIGYRGPGGTGTLATTGAYSFGNGYATGKQAVFLDTWDTLSAPAAGHIDGTAGAVAIRFKRTNDTGMIQYLFAAGDDGLASNDFISMRINGSDAQDAVFKTGGGALNVLTGAAVTLSEWEFGYMEWDGTATALALGADALTAGTRDTPTGTVDESLYIGGFAATSFYFHGWVDSVAVFDGPLTANERAYLRLTDEPWTWQMALPDPITAYVDTVPSNGTRVDAPVLILP